MKDELRRRRGLEDDNIYTHAAESIEWAKEWPSLEVLRHLRKIIALTWPIDREVELTESKARIVAAYVRYARTKLIHDRMEERVKEDDAMHSLAERTKTALEKEWRLYRSEI